MLFKAFTLGLLLFTVGAPLGVRAETDYTPKIETTDVRQDLLANTEFKLRYSNGEYDTASFSSDPTGNPEGIWPIQFTEWAYNHVDYALYFYVWNETSYANFDFESPLNGISIQKVDTGSYYLYPIELINKYKEQFYKFKITISGLNKDTFLTDSGSRQYSLGQLHLKKKSSGLATAYSFGKQYIYTGLVADETINMTQNDIETLSVNVNGGTYNVQASQEDVFRHSELHYVYYSIPDSMIEKYGDVAEYHFSYHPIQLAPIAALAGSPVDTSTLVSTSNPNDFASNYYARYQWLNNRASKYTNYGSYEYGITAAYLAANSLNNVGIIASKTIALANVLGAFGLAFVTYGAGALLALGSPAVWAYSEILAGEGWELLRDLYIDNGYNTVTLINGTDDVTSDRLDSAINLNNLSTWSTWATNTALRTRYSTFNNYFNALKVEEHLRYDQENYQLKTYRKDQYSFAKDGVRLASADEDWNVFQNDVVSVAPIEQITAPGTGTQTEEMWKLEKNSGSDFRSFYTTSIANNRTPYIFRFAPTPSTVYPLYWTKTNNGSGLFGIGELTVADCTRIGTLYSGFGIYNLTSLDLTFAKEGQETIIPIAADPININPRIDHATASESDNWLAMLQKLLTIILIVLLVMFSLWILFKIIGWTRRAFAK